MDKIVFTSILSVVRRLTCSAAAKLNIIEWYVSASVIRRLTVTSVSYVRPIPGGYETLENGTIWMQEDGTGVNQEGLII